MDNLVLLFIVDVPLIEICADNDTFWHVINSNLFENFGSQYFLYMYRTYRHAVKPLVKNVLKFLRSSCCITLPSPLAESCRSFCMYELLVGTIALKDISRKQWNTVNIGTTQVKMIQTINMEQFLQKTIMVH